MNQRIAIGWLLGLLLVAMPAQGSDKMEKLKSFKGWELYSWQVGKDWKFSLLEGTNRAKACAEVKGKKETKSLPDLEKTLDKLASGEQIVWMGAKAVNLADKCELALPPADVVKKLETHCTKHGLSLSVMR